MKVTQSMEELNLEPNLTVPEVAAFFRVTNYTVRQWLGSNEFPRAYKAGRSWLIPKGDVVAHMEKLYGEKD